MSSTFVVANTYAHTITYISDKMLSSLKFIIRESGLDPSMLTNDWKSLDLGIRTWLGTQDLDAVILEVYDPQDNNLVGRWDFDIIYDYRTNGDGTMWVDTEAIRHAIRKAGHWPSLCKYRIVADTKPGRPNVQGWSPTTLLSTNGFARHAIGTTIGAVGTGTGTAYWKRY